MAENRRNVGTRKRAAETKVGPDHIHTSPGKTGDWSGHRSHIFCAWTTFGPGKIGPLAVFSSNLVRNLHRTSPPVIGGPRHL